MHDVKVKLKDGTTYCSPMWKWRPKQGWFSLVGDVDDDGPVIIYLKDVESAIEYGQRTRIDKIEDVDLLERARKDGWKEE